jgi:DNA repair protein RadC
MNINTAKRKNKHNTYRFIVTSVVSEYAINYKDKNNQLDTPERAFEYWKTFIVREPAFEKDKENLVVVLLNAKLVPYAWNIVSIGTLSETTAHPREILRPCIAGAAHSFVLMHNHPSGYSDPSRADEQLTHRIREAAMIMQIGFVDHVIIGETYYSFREAGVL